VLGARGDHGHLEVEAQTFHGPVQCGEVVRRRDSTAAARIYETDLAVVD
jgi:hypothetical protein